jgi:RAD54-like protein 2
LFSVLASTCLFLLQVILNWKKFGGVLLMGYELYRLLATRTQRKKRKTKKVAAGPLFIDIEEEDKEKLMLDGKNNF